MNLANFSINIPALTINYYGLLLISSFFIYIAILLVLTIKEKYKNYEIASLVALECISWLIALLFFRSSFYALLLIVLSGLIIFLITKAGNRQQICPNGASLCPNGAEQCNENRLQCS